MEYCNCKEKQIIEKGDGGMFIAEETYCPKHGRYTDCYLCNSEVFTTCLCNQCNKRTFNIEDL